MLTKNDLNQIRGVIKEEIGVVDKKLSAKIDTVDKKLSAKIDTVDKKLDKAQEDISVILTEVISGHSKLEKRVERIEDSLDISNPH